MGPLTSAQDVLLVLLEAGVCPAVVLFSLCSEFALPLRRYLFGRGPGGLLFRRGAVLRIGDIVQTSNCHVVSPLVVLIAFEPGGSRRTTSSYSRVTLGE